MKKTAFLITTLAISCYITTAQATLIDAWDFFGLSATTSSTATPSLISATIGTGSLDVSAFGLGTPQGTSPQRTSFAGTQLNTFSGSTDTTGNGTSLAFANQAANGQSAIFSFSMTGYQNLIVSLASQGTSTGFNSGTWSWSTDGSTYNLLAGANTASRTAFSVFTVDFTSITDIDDASAVYLKYTLSGATSGTGNNRIDNVQFNVTPVPEPGTMALAALGGFGCLFVLRRRK